MNPKNNSNGPVSMKNLDFDFDFGLPSRQSSKPLKDQKQPHSGTPNSGFSSSNSGFSASGVSSYSSVNKPAWTHQPAPGKSNQMGASSLMNPTSMVGDIYGKSWVQQSNPKASLDVGVKIGIAEKNTNLFGDLVGSALGQGKSNLPLKESTTKSAFSMGNLASSDPKPSSNPAGSGNSRTSAALGGGGWGDFTGSVPGSGNLNKGSGTFTSLGSGFPTTGGSGGNTIRKNGDSGGSARSGNDPFVILGDFGAKRAPMNHAPVNSSNHSNSASAFGDFVTAAAPSVGKSTGSFPSSNSFATQMPEFSSTKQTNQTSGGDPLDMLFTSNTASNAGVSQGQSFSESDDWGAGFEFGGGDDGSTTELDALPPPPVGVTVTIAMNKGLENQKNGQFADAIKWLSWGLVLVEKLGNDASSSVEILSCRAACYKEVGEYKKAVADCSKVLEVDNKNVSVLLQRALLYESTEKYKLGAEDLRMVLKLDPGNRLAKGTLHRLVKLAD